MESAGAGLVGSESCRFFYSLPLFFSEAEGRKKADCPPLSLFVLSNLTYVIYQVDRLFGNQMDPGKKSSGFSKCEKLGSGGLGGKALCVCGWEGVRSVEGTLCLCSQTQKLLRDIQASPLLLFPSSSL